MKRVHVLLVESDAERRHRIEQALIDQPFELRSVRTAAEAGRMVAEYETHVAVVNSWLPDESGEELCRKLRTAHRREALQIVLMVDSVNLEALFRLLDQTIDDYVHISDIGDDLRLRVKAAARRAAQHISISGEREYYRRAARQEEELTSRVLDQNLDLKRQNEQLKRDPRLDPVTGLLGNAALFGELDVEIERALRCSASLCGFVLRVDRADEIISTFGSEAMNRIHATLGKVLRAQLRKYDVCGKLDSVRFFTALPGVGAAQAVPVARRFLRIGDLMESETAGVGTSVTLSAGVAAFHDGESRELWVSRTEDGMIRAAESGGNAVELEVDTRDTAAV